MKTLSANLSYCALTGLLLLVLMSARMPPPGATVDPDSALPSALLTFASGQLTAPGVAPAAAPAVQSLGPIRLGPTIGVGAAALAMPDVWSHEEIATALQTCMKLLAPLAADIEPLAPLKHGACGTPAPIRLERLTAGGTTVAFEPAVEVNCPMAAALAKWVAGTLQPATREAFGTAVTSVIGASAYACRNRYNRPDDILSEHAFANAIDIGAFGLADGRTIRVSAAWGPTARDKAKAAVAERAPARKAADGKTITTGNPQSTTPVPGAAARSQVSFRQAALRLGGAASAGARSAGRPGDGKPTAEARFLRALHGGACRVFGTVLGPEANDAHRDHFHLDLKPRRSTAFCQ